MLSIQQCGDDFSVENSVFSVLNEFFTHYLISRDSASVLPLLSDQFYSIGTGEGEVILNKDAFIHQLDAELVQLPGPVSFTIIDYTEKERFPGCRDCLCNMEVNFFLPDGAQAGCRIRVTAGFHYEKDRYLMDILHTSRASKCQENGKFLLLKFMTQDADVLSEETRYELMELIGQTMPGGIIGGYMEEGFPLYVANQRLLELAGYDNYDDFNRDINGLIINTIHPEDQEYVNNQMARLTSLGDQYELEYRMKKSDGSYFWVHDMGRRTITTDGREAIISVLTDISRQIQIRAKLEHQASSDPLTGIYNRQGGQVHIAQALEHFSHYLFFMVDLDNFKLVNDFYGHQQGDDVLCLAAQLLSDAFHQHGIICRLGGDEFAVFLPDYTEYGNIEEQIQTIIQSYQQALEQNWPEAHSTMSAGGIYGSKKRTFSELYQLADQVLYQVKNAEKGQKRLLKLE